VGSNAPERDVIRRVTAAVAALICLLFAATLRDSRATAAGWEPPPLPMPARAGDQATSGSVRITVRGEGGSPIERAVVRVFAVASDGVLLVGERRTGPGGVAVVERAPPGETWVVAYAAERARASAPLLVRARETGEIALTLPRALALRVAVSDDAERALPGAPVVVDDGDALPHVVATGEDGEALFERLGAAPWTVSATSPGLEPAVKRDVFPGPGTLRLRLERLGAVEVAVIDAAGEPAEGATVTIGGPALWPARTATTGDEGTVRIGGLRDGVVDLRARLGEQVSDTLMGVRVARGETTRATLVLELGRAIAVRVSDGASPVGGPPADPIEGAEVVLAEEGVSTFPLEAVTGGDGEALLGPVVEARATLTVAADGFVPRTLGIGEEELDTGFIEVPLLRGGTIEGRVVDARGRPVAGATLEVVGTDGDGMPVAMVAPRSLLRDRLFDLALTGPLALIPRGELGVMPGPVPPIPTAGAALSEASATGDAAPWVTDGDGRFAATPVVPGRLRVLARHPDFVEGESELVRVEPGGAVTVKIVLAPGGRLEGRVRERDGTPVAARVVAASARGSFERTTYAAPDGTFAFAAVPAELVVTVARPDAPADVVSRIAVDAPPGRRTEIDVVLPAPRDDVAVRVVDRRGSAVPTAEIRAESLDVDVPLRRTVFTDGDGVATVPSAVGVPLRLVLRAPGFAPAALELDPARREERVELTAGLVVRGRVTGNGGRERIAGADVTFYTETGITAAMTDDDGGFELSDLAPGRARAAVRAAGWPERELDLTIAGDDRRPIELPPIDLPRAGSVEGVVVSETGEPVAGARVGLDAVPTWLPLGPLPSSMVTTDRDGRFTLPWAPEGRVRIEAYDPDHGRGAVEDVAVRPGRTTDAIEIALEGGSPRRGPPPPGSVALTLGERGGRVVIVGVPRGSEAEAARVLPDDALLEVDARPVRTIEAARAALGGPLAIDVLLGLEREGRRVRMRVRREPIRR
jgi:hypothetical protein